MDLDSRGDISHRNYSAINELFLIEKNMKNYNENIVNMMLAPISGFKNVLEFGAGIGTLSTVWFSKTGIKPDCLEIDASLVEILKQRSFVVYEDLSHAPKEYDVIFSSNVLEHVYDDVDCLNKIRNKMKTAGHLILYLPAFNFLYNNFDREVGHYRRYNKAELRDKLKQAGYIIENMCYADSVGFLAWFLLKWKKNILGQDSSNNINLKIYDKIVHPVSLIFDFFGAKFFFGKNIIVHARKF